jgi:hypothetical protein
VAYISISPGFFQFMIGEKNIEEENTQKPETHNVNQRQNPVLKIAENETSSKNAEGGKKPVNVIMIISAAAVIYAITYLSYYFFRPKN